MILSRKRILFWAGSDFFANYLEESWSDSIANVIGEELINKLVFMYENSQSLVEIEPKEGGAGQELDLMNKKLDYSVEGIETKLWREYIGEKVAPEDAAKESIMNKMRTRGTIKRNY